MTQYGLQRPILALRYSIHCRNKKDPRLLPGRDIHGADNGVRTRDPHLGKVVLYQLSHVRARRYNTLTPYIMQEKFLVFEKIL